MSQSASQRQGSTRRDDISQVQELLSTDENLRHDNHTSVRNIPSRERKPSQTFSTECVLEMSDLGPTRRSVCSSEYSPYNDDYNDAASTDEEEAYRKLKRRYRRRGFFASSGCCAEKGDVVDGVVDVETMEDKLAEFRYEKISLTERRERYRAFRRSIEGDQVDSSVRKFSCMKTAHRTTGFFSNLFSQLNALRYLKKLIQARGGGGVMAVFDLIQILLVLNFVTGLLFFSAVFVPDKIWGSYGTSVPCNRTAVCVPAVNSSDCSEIDNNSTAVNASLQKMLDIIIAPVQEMLHVFSDSKLFAGSYDYWERDIYSIDKAYFVCLSISYVLSISFVVKALVNWLQLKQRFKFSDSRNTITTLLFKGWNSTADTNLGKKTEQAFLTQELFSVKDEEPAFNFDPVISRKRMIIHVVSAIVTLMGLSAVAIAVKYCKNEFIISLIISVLCKSADLLFSWLGKKETRPNHDELFWLILRCLSFHLMTIGVMAFSELILSKEKNYNCWETHYAEQIYSMVLTVGIKEISKITIFPLLQWILAKMCQCFMKAKTGGRKNVSNLGPEYETDAHLYNLIELQTLGWLALPVSPLMPLLVCLVLLLCLFVNMSIVLFMKLRPKRWFGVARSSSFFATALLLSWVMCIWPIMYVMFKRKPSPCCSPFRNLEQQYRALYSADSDLILLLVLMLCCMEGAFLMLFFLLRPRAAAVGNYKHLNTQKYYPGTMNADIRENVSPLL